MEFKQTFSREFLLSAYEKNRTDTKIRAITDFIERTWRAVVIEAQRGKTQCLIEIRSDRKTGWNDDQYMPTNDDLIEGFRLKFPDCVVRYGETWESSSRNPNQMNKKSGIIIDWS